MPPIKLGMMLLKKSDSSVWTIKKIVTTESFFDDARKRYWIKSGTAKSQVSFETVYDESEIMQMFDIPEDKVILPENEVMEKVNRLDLI